MSKLNSLDVMKNQTATSFEDLMKSYYGRPRTQELSSKAKVEALLTDYYGQPYKRKKRCKTQPPAVSLSISQDNGEIIEQVTKDEPFEEYVVQQSAEVETFEEYVVGDASHFSETAVAASLNIESVEPVTAAQEYEVDVLDPLRNSSSAQPLSVEAGLRYQDPLTPVDSESSSPLAAEERSRAKASEDDFISDMKSILSGRAVFDQETGKTVDRFSRRPSREPGRNNDQTFPAADKAQAIFDRIAQSMQYANAYDLGTVELENRFADFDRMADLQQRARETKKANKQEKRDPVAPAKVSNEDFIRDLDAIHNARTEPATNAERSESLSAAVATVTDQVDSACIPFSLSLSETDDPVHFSRPLYDTGEHVLTAWDIYTDQLHVGKAPGVMFSYGQLIAMPDLFESVEQMMGADVNELQTLKTLIQSDTGFYQDKMRGKANPKGSVPQKRWKDATRKNPTDDSRYIELAKKNYEHFSPAPVFKSLPAIACGKGNNKIEWESHHRWAIQEAQQIFLAPENANRTVFLEYPLIINAFGDHFLTDAFAAGHLINKEATIAYFTSNFFTGNNLKPESKTFFNKVAEKAFHGKVKQEFSKLESYKTKYGVHWDIDRPSRFAEVLIKAAEMEKEAIGNLAVKALHDKLNEEGLEVTNNAGSGIFKVFGDEKMNAMDKKSVAIITQAVQKSIDNINDPGIRRSNLDFNAYFEKVWRYVPQLTPASLEKVELRTREYTDPNSSKLVDASAQLIHKQLETLIEEIIAKKGLRPNTEGWLPNVL